MLHLLKNIEKQRIETVSNLRLKIYIISPFKKVKEAYNGRIKQEYIGGIENGTIDTFQGKEANIVFLVLRTSKERDGLGARMWVSASPNLLNIALTCAKARLYVIGNAQCWAELIYFSTLHNLLIKKDY